MSGDDRTRFCGKCGESVHDLDARSEKEVKALLAGSGPPPCVQYRVNRSSLAALVAFLVGLFGLSSAHATDRPRMLRGKVRVSPTPVPTPPPPTPVPEK